MLGLSCELGIKYSDIENMSERDINLYKMYQSTKLFPSQRYEIYLAQIAHVLAIANGAKTEVSDFLIKLNKTESKKVSKKVTRNDDAELFFNM